MPLLPASLPLRLALAALLLCGLLYAGALALLWFGQERLLFLPEPLPPQAPLAQSADVHERFVEVPGARLSVLELRLADPAGVVFFLHGNAGNLQSWFVNADFYRRARYDLVMLDYRGYGKSSGQIESEAQLHADVQAVWDSVAARYRGKRVVVYGRSLGTGLAAALAERIAPDLTLLVSPYLSMQALAAQHYPWVPGALLRYPLRTDQSVARLHGPVLLLHGAHDGVIPSAHSLALARLNPRARVVLIDGAGHDDLQQFPGYLAAVRDALAAP